jgi:hypothetical protein
LSRAADADLNSSTARTAFFGAVSTVGTDGDRAAVLTTLLKKPKLAPETVVAAIDTAMTIGSDGDKNSVLVLAAERHGTNPAVRDALMRARFR